MSVSLVARQHRVGPNQGFKWRQLYAEGALSAIGASEDVVAASEYRALQTRCVNCNDRWARRPSRTRSCAKRWTWPSQKNGCAVALIRSGQHAVKTIAQTVGVARSNLVVQAAKQQRPRYGSAGAGDPAGRRAAGRDQGHNCRSADLRLSAHSCAASATAPRTGCRAGQCEAGLPGNEGARPYARTPHRQR
jgi:transposase-like protein